MVNFFNTLDGLVCQQISNFLLGINKVHLILKYYHEMRVG